MPRDRGDFTLAFDPPQTAAESAVERVLKDRHGADFLGLARGLSDRLALPRDITIKIDHGDPSPYFDPERREIHLQYDFVIYVERVYRELRPSDHSLARAARLVDFVLVHEIGHALVDAYAIPVRGREEDAVDALATVMMARFVEGGDDIAVAGADFFGALADRRGTSFSESDFWDEHSFDRRHAGAIACGVGAERPRSCPDEYRQKVKPWLSVLKPHVKE